MGWFANQMARHEAAQARPRVKVVKVKGERRMERTINQMQKKGWTLKDSTSRKAFYSLATGVFTRKQIHTLIFEKPVD